MDTFSVDEAGDASLSVEECISEADVILDLLFIFVVEVTIVDIADFVGVCIVFLDKLLLMTVDVLSEGIVYLVVTTGVVILVDDNCFSI